MSDPNLCCKSFPPSIFASLDVMIYVVLFCPFSSLTRWYSRVAIQGVRQEIADGLENCVKAALRSYVDVCVASCPVEESASGAFLFQLNGALPDRIVVFRDGVGDGQMNTVKEYEVPQMMACFSSFEENYHPKFAVVVVQKRISTRIFHRGGAKGLANPPPGTVVDHTITRKGW